MNNPAAAGAVFGARKFQIGGLNKQSQQKNYLGNKK